MSKEFNAAGACEYVRCSCQNCSEHFEIPKDYIGSTHSCPHCKVETLIVEAPAPPVVFEKAKAQPRFDLDEEFPTTPIKLHFRKSPPFFTLLIILFGAGGILMVIAGFADSASSKTVFQEINSTVVMVGGIIAVGVASLLTGVSSVCRYLNECAERLENIQNKRR